MSWLDPVRRALDAATQPVPVFFRDDDAGWADDRLFALLDEFVRAELPVDVALIPTVLSQELADELRIRVENEGVHLHQHGFRHVNHQGDGRKYEFGSDRTRAEQQADVLAGQRILIEALGDLVEPIFTPPWNRCTAATTAAVAEVGLRVLSRDGTASALDLHGLTEVRVTVDWFGKRKGVRWTRDELAQRLAAQVGEAGPIGVMLHHEVTDERDLALVAELLRLVAAHDRAAPTTIMSLATQAAS